MPARYHKGVPPAGKYCPFTRANDAVDYFVITENNLLFRNAQRGKLYFNIQYFENALKLAGWLPPRQAKKVKDLNTRIAELKAVVAELSEWRDRTINAISAEFYHDVSGATRHQMAPVEELEMTKLIVRESTKGLDSVPDDEGNPEAVPTASKNGV